MIFAGVDTSGDHDPSSPLVVSVVLSDDSPSVKDSLLGKAVNEVRRALGKANYVLHATDDSESVRRLVVSTFEKYGIRSRVVVFLDRGKANRKGLLESLKGLDLRGTFAVYDNPLLDNVLERLARKARKVSLGEELSLPLQVADYFSYFWWALFSGELKDFKAFEGVMVMTEEVKVVGFEKVVSLTASNEASQ